MYNGNVLYTDMVARAFGLWTAEAKRWGRSVYRKTGAIWIFEGDDAFARSSVPLLKERGIPVEQLSPDEAARRFPQIRFDGARTVYVESDAGFLLARQSCELVRQSVIDGGGAYVQARAIPGRIGVSGLDGVRLASGERLQADAYVFACGPWMGSVFPEVVGRGIIATRQDVLYFGTPPDDRRFDDDHFPVWVNVGARRMYGIPGNERRGFKVADDTEGGEIDPSTMNRVVSPEALRIARRTLARRFPALRDAPLVESRVCQYEYSPDGDFLLDRHPGARNVWLLGGGSGHGFKMGPALGEYVARLVLDGATTATQFSYDQFRAGRTRLKRDGVRKQHS
jgi:glycine/D-amino acid oxidase-like deaminating enzyme